MYMDQWVELRYKEEMKLYTAPWMQTILEHNMAAFIRAKVTFWLKKLRLELPRMRLGVSVVCHLVLSLMNDFNKTETDIFPMQSMLP